MNQEIKDKWLTALRSGEYKQGRERLRIGDSYCCLGVLCDIYIKETNNGEWYKSPNSDGYSGMCRFILPTASEASTLPSIVYDWAGLKSNNPILPSKKVSLAGLNDDGHSFETLADLIEKEL